MISHDSDCSYYYYYNYYYGLRIYFYSDGFFLYSFWAGQEFGGGFRILFCGFLQVIQRVPFLILPVGILIPKVWFFILAVPPFIPRVFFFILPPPPSPSPPSSPPLPPLPPPLPPPPWVA